MKRVFDWIIDKWLAGFITASFFFILKLYVELPVESKSNFFSFKWLTDLLKTQISLSCAAIIILAIVVFTRIEKSLIKSKRKNQNYDYLKAPKNDFENYRRDSFGVNKSIWTWKYEWRPYERKFVIADLKPSCRQCGTPMEINTFYSSDSAECHKCRLDGKRHYFPLTEHIADVDKEIVRRIHNNEVKF